MNEAIVRRELYQMLRYKYNLWPDHWPDIKGVKESGRPDLVVMSPTGPGFYIEVKAIYADRAKSFSFVNINTSQRRWLSAWEEVRSNGSWLGIGTVNCSPRHTWLIPWLRWLQLEQACHDLDVYYLPLSAGKGERKVLQEAQIDFGLLGKYLLLGQSTKGWYMSEELEQEFFNGVST